jgi:hypothetical protein
VFEPKLPEVHPEGAQTFPQKVYCLARSREANIVVANWPLSEEGWSDWRVIDCSLLPTGTVSCGMDCLSQAKIVQK